MSNSSPDWDTHYEWRTALLLGAGFALVGLDRFIIVPLFPVMMADLNLSYQDLGLITGSLAFTWGLAALLMGNLSDQLGRRTVLVGSMMVFSALVGLSGLATGVGTLVAIRAVMGLAEGAFTAPSIAATLDAARPDRRGRMLGIQQMLSPPIALGVLPIMVAYLLQYIDWRWIFALSAVPGALLAIGIWRLLRESPRTAAPRNVASLGVVMREIRASLAYADIKWLMIAMTCWLNCLVVLSMLLPGYLTGSLGLSLTDFGHVLSAMGFGAFCGSVVLPMASDYFGRRPTMVMGAAIAVIALLMMSQTGPRPWLLFCWLFVTMFCTYGLIGLTIGPAAYEAVPQHLHATSTGAVIAAGEILGGGIAPLIAGSIAHAYGVQQVFAVAAGGMFIGIVACACVKGSAGVGLPASDAVG